MLNRTAELSDLAGLATKLLRKSHELNRRVALGTGGDVHELTEAYYHLLYAQNEIDSAVLALDRAEVRLPENALVDLGGEG
jgi:hypothetical protein